MFVLLLFWYKSNQISLIETHSPYKKGETDKQQTTHRQT